MSFFRWNKYRKELIKNNSDQEDTIEAVKDKKENSPMTYDKNNKEQKSKEDFSNTLFQNLEDNIENIKKMLDNSSDLTVRQIVFSKSEKKVAAIYIDGLVDKLGITQTIITKIESFKEEVTSLTNDELISLLEHEVISSSSVTRVKSLDDVMLGVLSGDTAVFVDSINEVLMVGTRGWETRGLSEPNSEALVRGPRIGFTENIRTNTVLIRRQIRDTNLRFDNYFIGRRSKRNVVVAYIDGIINPKIVKEVKRRLKAIDIDDAPESGIIEQWIQDSFLSPFPQIQNTERPDRVAASLLEGRAAILLDGTPFVLLVPTTLGQLFQSPADYYERWLLGSMIRSLRYMAAFISLFLPAIYIALVTYHPGMIPTRLAFSITATREGVPVPALIEALMMEITMELLREAGIRLPKPIGQTIGIVGGLVIGDAAVRAGIVSPIMVIVVALTAISSFAIPSYSLAISFRILRFALMIAASIFGLYGLIIGYIMINIHLANLKSFGVPYTTPFAPAFFSDWKDLVIRVPRTMANNRPKMMMTKDPERGNKGGEN